MPGVGEWRYLVVGEKSLTTSGQTRSVSSWLNSLSYVWVWVCGGCVVWVCVDVWGVGEWGCVVCRGVACGVYVGAWVCGVCGCVGRVCGNVCVCVCVSE